MMQFTAHEPFLKHRKTDGGITVEFQLPKSEYDNVKDLPKWEGQNYRVTVEPLDSDQ